MFSDHIRNPTLLKILERIEHHLGYRVRSEAMNRSHLEEGHCAVKYDETQKEWTFLSPPNPNTGTVCHELMHLALWVEGYPVYFPRHKLNGTVLYKYLLSVLSDLPVYEITDYLALEQPTELADNAKAAIANLRRIRPSPVSDIGALFDHAINYATTELSPIDAALKHEQRRYLQDNFPRILGLADNLLAMIAKYRPVTPATHLPLATAILEYLGLDASDVKVIHSNLGIGLFRDELKRIVSSFS